MLHEQTMRHAMADKGANAAELVTFGAVLAASQAFSTCFREGMALVEETAAYLDGPGRQDAKKLERAAALAYATESMRLTTRLMQLASWLLLHRAVNEGEMSLAQASREKKKVKLVPSAIIEEATLRMLPARLRDLIERSSRLLDKVRRLDATIHAQPSPEASPSPVRHHITQLRAAFERADT
jgi:regulator of CtrA degradation